MNLHFYLFDLIFMVVWHQWQCFKYVQKVLDFWFCQREAFPGGRTLGRTGPKGVCTAGRWREGQEQQWLTACDAFAETSPKQAKKQTACQWKRKNRKVILKHCIFSYYIFKKKDIYYELYVGCRIFFIHQGVFYRTDLSSGLGHSCGPIERQEDGEYATVTGGDDCHRWRMTWWRVVSPFFKKNQLDVKRRACFSVRKVELRVFLSLQTWFKLGAW